MAFYILIASFSVPRVGPEYWVYYKISHSIIMAINVTHSRVADGS